MRKEYIHKVLDYLQTHDSLSTQQAQKLLYVSVATARRIFNYLAASGSVKRIHGGVCGLPMSEGKTIPFQLRTQWESLEKELLARKALEYLSPDSTTFIHNGSSTLFLGKYISSGTVITDSVSLPELLIHRFPGEAGPKVVLCGGVLDRKGGMVYGYKAEHAVAGYHADFMITGVCGIDARGPMDLNDRSVGIQRAMMEQSEHVIIIADHKKFHTHGPCYIGSWKEVHTLITTDSPDNRELCDQIRQAGTEVVALPLISQEEPDPTMQN